MKPDCNQFLDWMCWIAQVFDGAWWAYEHEPNMADNGWYENEVGLSAKLSQSSENTQWRETLEQIKR